MSARVLSGMRPSGKLHLGNFWGALNQWRGLQEGYECFYCIADWHALTTDYANTVELPDLIQEMGIDWLAAGLDPARSTLFVQSRVPEHAELHLLLSMITPLAWLERNPTYKEQQAEMENRDLGTYGFLGYPVLQAADIIIYKANFVPVGVDQAPHVEITREIARRFNYLYGQEVFPLPEVKLTQTPKLSGIDGRKMSKSYDNAIFLSDRPETIRHKVKIMMTDPARVRRHDPGNPEICPVFSLHRLYTPGEEVEEVAVGCRTAAIGCVDCKEKLSRHLLAALAPLGEKREQLVARPACVQEVLEEGSKRARGVAQATLAEAKAAMHL